MSKLVITYAEINIDEDKEKLNEKFGITPEDALYFASLMLVCKINRKGVNEVIKQLHEQQRFDFIYYLASCYCEITSNITDKLKEELLGEEENDPDC